MRRKDREMPKEFALEVADKCEWATLGMVTSQGMPYCVPITIARDGEVIYFHSAHEGLKIDCLRGQSQVCLACVGDTKRATNRFTTEFESALIQGPRQRGDGGSGENPRPPPDLPASHPCQHGRV